MDLKVICNGGPDDNPLLIVGEFRLNLEHPGIFEKVVDDGFDPHGKRGQSGQDG